MCVNRALSQICVFMADVYRNYVLFNVKLHPQITQRLQKLKKKICFVFNLQKLPIFSKKNLNVPAYFTILCL